MASVKILAGLLALALAGSPAAADDGGGRDRYRKALELYENGMYEEARTIFETLEGNALVDGYTVLCADLLFFYSLSCLCEPQIIPPAKNQ